MHISTERKLSRKTPVYDHADAWLYDADREQARDLMRRRDVDVIGTSSRVKAIRFQGPDPARCLSGSRRRRGLGTPHQNENYYNIRGCWHIDRVPDELRPEFHAVVVDCSQEAV